MSRTTLTQPIIVGEEVHRARDSHISLFLDSDVYPYGQCYGHRQHRHKPNNNGTPARSY